MMLKAGLLLGMLLGMGSFAAHAQIESDSGRFENNRSMEYRYGFAEGLRYKMLGDLPGARRWFETCLDLFPDSAAPAYEMATILYAEKNFQSAQVYAKRAWEKAPGNSWYGQMYGETLAKLGQYEEAAVVYEAIAQLRTDIPAYFLAQIDLLIQAGSWKKVLKAVAEKGKNPEYHRWSVLKTSDILNRKGDQGKARQNLEKHLRKNAGDIEARGILAESYLAADQPEKAGFHYAELRKLEPANPAVRFSYAQFLFGQGRRDEALIEYIEGFKSGDVNPLIKIQILLDYLNRQEQQDSLDHEVVVLLETLYQHEKGNPQVDALYANYLYNTERHAEAEGVYDRVLNNDPANFLAWQNQLFVMNSLRKYARMDTLSGRALEYYPNQPLFYLMRGLALSETGKLDEAVAVLKGGMKYPSGNPELTKQFYLSIADVLHKKGDDHEAFGYFEDLLTLDPDHVVVLNNYSYYLAVRNEQLDKALTMITRCIELEPDNPTYLDTYAWVLYRLGKMKDALKMIRRVMELDPEPSAEVVEHLGDILLANGMTSDAVKAWKRALDLEPEREGVKEKIALHEHES